MKTIHKFPIQNRNGQEVEINAGGQIISAQWQGNEICLWALVETESPMIKRRIFIFDTGEEIPQHQTQFLYHHATIQIGVGVRHVFEYMK